MFIFSSFPVHDGRSLFPFYRPIEWNTKSPVVKRGDIWQKMFTREALYRPCNAFSVRKRLISSSVGGLAMR